MIFQIFASELAALLIFLSCLPPTLSAWAFSRRGDKLALKRTLYIVPILLVMGIVFTVGALALGMKVPKTLLTVAYCVLGLIGVLISLCIHILDRP